MTSESTRVAEPDATYTASGRNHIYTFIFVSYSHSSKKNYDFKKGERNSLEEIA